MPRAGLTKERVVDEAVRMADEVGLSRLTLAALALRLGVRPPSLYKHIDDMDDLQRAIAIRAKSELAEMFARAAVGRARGDAIVAVAVAYRDWAIEHPGRYSATVPAPAPGDVDDEAASAAVVKVGLDVMAGYELRGDDAVDALRALRAALHGFVTLEAGGGFGLPVDVDRSFDRLVGGLVLAFDRWNDEVVSAAGSS
jgi:AcrR family transcriptional regulator